MTSDRLATVSEYYFSRKLQELAAMNAEGKDVINLGIGSPDLPPAPAVIDALTQHVKPAENHKYQSYKGTPEFRKAFSSWYKKKFRVNLNPETDILPLIGSKEGIMHISMAFLNDGDEVLVPNPGYPSYQAAANLAGAVIRPYQLKSSNEWAPDFNNLENEGLDRVKLMWVNYPHMPTGAGLTNHLMGKLVDFARKHQIILVNDNPYSFILNDHPQSILKFARPDDMVIELNSLSKSHNMAGWRVGMAAGNPELIQNILTFKSNMDSGMFLPIQKAAIVAMEANDSWYKSLNKIYEKRRKLAWQFLDMLGCSYEKDTSGMFVWAHIPGSCKNGGTLSDEILYQHNVFITPGFIFGSEGDQFVRVSLCTPEEIWNTSINRIKNLINHKITSI